MQRLCTAFAMLLTMGTVHADDAAVLRCRQINDAAQRLSCYDSMEVTPATESRPRQAPEEFGLVKNRRDEAQAVESELAAALDGWRSNDVIHLANGQKWQIADGSSGVLRAGARKVRVRRGAFGAFYMEFEGLNKSPRVNRIQ